MSDNFTIASCLERVIRQMASQLFMVVNLSINLLFQKQLSNEWMGYLKQRRKISGNKEHKFLKSR